MKNRLNNRLMTERRKFNVCGVTCEPDKPECNNYCNMKTVNGKKFVGPMPDSPAILKESTTEQESQEVWKNLFTMLYDECEMNANIFSTEQMIDKLKPYFTITRKP